MEKFVSYEYDRHLRAWCVSLMGVVVYVRPRDFKPLKDSLNKLNESYKEMVNTFGKYGIIR